MSRIEELKKEIKELEEKTTALQQELKLERQKKEIDYPFYYTEKCYLLSSNGVIVEDWWSHSGNDQKRYRQGNFFKTKEEAQRERDRRDLLTRFRQYRDKCNGDWKPDWNNIHEGRYYIHLYPTKGKCSIGQDAFQDSMPQFGRFKNVDDCLRAIELFGDEIIRLFVEE